MTQPLRIGLAGLGTVGAGVAHILLTQGNALAMRAGPPVTLTAASAQVVRDNNLDLSRVAREEDPLALIGRADVDVVVELMGGHEGAALALVEGALAAKKHVVTANKALLAHHGGSLAQAADKSGVTLAFEAAVGGGIPIVRALKESLIAFEATEVKGILNGTCNFILTQMEATGRPFEDILAEAQKLGYAEADPTLDVGGGDTAHKTTLLASLAFGIVPDLDAVSTSGIERIKPADIAFAREIGCRIKLLGIARRHNGLVEQRVHPSLVKIGTPLADVDGSFNAVMVDLGEAGPYTFEGRGAGRGPTASAVIADIVAIARGVTGPAFGRPAASLTRAKAPRPDARTSSYYLRFQVLDAPGIMAFISKALADRAVSIDSTLQRGGAPGDPVSIVMVTHEAPHVEVARALKTIAASDRLFEEPCMIPIDNG